MVFYVLLFGFIWRYGGFEKASLLFLFGAVSLTAGYTLSSGFVLVMFKVKERKLPFVAILCSILSLIMYLLFGPFILIKSLLVAVIVCCVLGGYFWYSYRS
jgi:hypothetical protein